MGVRVDKVWVAISGVRTVLGPQGLVLWALICQQFLVLCGLWAFICQQFLVLYSVTIHCTGGLFHQTYLHNRVETLCKGLFVSSFSFIVWLFIHFSVRMFFVCLFVCFVCDFFAVSPAVPSQQRRDCRGYQGTHGQAEMFTIWIILNHLIYNKS